MFLSSTRRLFYISLVGFRPNPAGAQWSIHSPARVPSGTAPCGSTSRRHSKTVHRPCTGKIPFPQACVPSATIFLFRRGAQLVLGKQKRTGAPHSQQAVTTSIKTARRHENTAIRSLIPPHPPAQSSPAPESVSPPRPASPVPPPRPPAQCVRSHPPPASSTAPDACPAKP